MWMKRCCIQRQLDCSQTLQARGAVRVLPRRELTPDGLFSGVQVAEVTLAPGVSSSFVLDDLARVRRSIPDAKSDIFRDGEYGGGTSWKRGAVWHVKAGGG